MSNPRRRSARGFTLIELLVVIAIIASLAALLFPVFERAKSHTRQATCLSNLRELVQAANVYYADWRVYPDALYGIRYAGGSFETRLYPDYSSSRSTFVCPDSWIRLPASDPGLEVTPLNPSTGLNTGQYARPDALPQWSSYDVAYSPNRPNGQPELRYQRKWTGAAVQGVADEPRQLAAKTPPVDTVVTWCTYHSGLDGTGAIPPDGMVLVAFLSGRVQKIPYSQLPLWTASTGPWTVKPRP
jgi:prepilin-type N-terminal cleavage/methylation domain-containing protein